MSTGTTFERLVEIMAKLRGPCGCPWDREQNYTSIVSHTLEEAHEVAEAIDRGDLDGLREELGDLLLQIVFYAQMASEEKRFTIDDVINGICDKIVHRHPHVFGDLKVTGTDEVLKNWEALKQKEGGTQKKSVLGGIPKALPALLKAYRLGEKTSRVGFDWTNAEGILKKIEEEVRELHEARGQKDEAAIDHEYGDLLFTLANCGRFLGIEPEGSLRRAADRFSKRFQWMERAATDQNRTLQSLTPEEWDDLWNRAKHEVAHE
ncbi:MAG: nucleoside triphosphate pyrophosphohydrolase [Deltaproteobacteria bacterium]|nr:nucleoside triphosphate pyrophosphohydrolase [Deltaproteobacteria bacterium]